MTVPDVTATLEDVTVRFGGIVALDSVTMEIRAGEVLGLIGPNGAGKTTLMNVLAGVLKPTSGEVRCFGERTNANSPVRQARRGIARTFQQLSLLR
jgi:branched-chain amino acid transport system ATP-binding protein